MKNEIEIINQRNVELLENVFKKNSQEIQESLNIQKKIDEAEALEKREANKKHQARIHNEALEVIDLKISLYFPIEILEEKTDLIKKTAKALIEAIARGEVPHVQINY